MDTASLKNLAWLKPLNIIWNIEWQNIAPKSNFKVLHASVRFQEFPISDALRARWKDEDTNARETWRKRPLLISEDSNCTYSCGEVELAIRFNKAGFRAKWVSEWSGFPYVPMWEKYFTKRSDLKTREPDIFQFDFNLRNFSLNRGVDLGRSGGHPDVAVLDPNLGWCFIEYKGPGDTIKPKQIHWAEALAAKYPDQVRYLMIKSAFGE